MSTNRIKVAIVYDRVNKFGGAEKVVLSLHELFPGAPLYTSVYDSGNAPWARIFPDIRTSFLQKFPMARNNHENLAPLMPLCFESFSFDGYDLVISVTSEAAKGIITKPGTKHICICLTPTRYLWSHHNEYFRNSAFRVFASPVVNYLRNWDWVAAQRPDVMVSISTAVKERIKKYYGRDSKLIFPPVDLEMFKEESPKKEINSNVSGKRGYFLYVGRLVPYKKVDLLVKVFNKINLPLIIVGTGSEEKKLRLSAGRNISFEGCVSDIILPGYYHGAEALVFPGEEDFGMVMVESMASGTPVIANGKGGALDIVRAGVSGEFFDGTLGVSLENQLINFDRSKFRSERIIKESKRFSKDIFKTQFMDLVENTLYHNST